MFISRLILKNWRNFKCVDVLLGHRSFLVGPNACGKSNFLDAFRFLAAIAKAGGGLQRAVEERGGLPKIRCLAARKSSIVEVAAEIKEQGTLKTWQYAIGVKQQNRKNCGPYLAYEKVYCDDRILVDRPTQEDRQDPLRLSQTHLEQIIANSNFRIIAKHLASVYYHHLVPQLIRHPSAFAGPGLPNDPHGQYFLEKVAQTPMRTKNARMKRIGQVLRVAVPQLKNLTDTRDQNGTPHLEAVYKHWRPNAGKQREDQFSDGTLRLIGLLWSCMEKNSLLLLEEPELSLNASIVQKLPFLMQSLQNKSRLKRQLIMSTHSSDLLNSGVNLDEILLLLPGKEGTEVQLASSITDIQTCLARGKTPSEAVLAHLRPPELEQLDLF
jgi:predicted ATPase